MDLIVAMELQLQDKTTIYYWAAGTGYNSQSFLYIFAVIIKSSFCLKPIFPTDLWKAPANIELQYLCSFTHTKRHNNPQTKVMFAFQLWQQLLLSVSKGLFKGI